jgi:hypothetical protein
VRDQAVLLITYACALLLVRHYIAYLCACTLLPHPPPGYIIAYFKQVVCTHAHHWTLSIGDFACHTWCRSAWVVFWADSGRDKERVLTTGEWLWGVVCAVCLAPLSFVENIRMGSLSAAVNLVQTLCSIILTSDTSKEAERGADHQTHARAGSSSTKHIQRAYASPNNAACTISRGGCFAGEREHSFVRGF